MQKKAEKNLFHLKTPVWTNASGRQDGKEWIAMAGGLLNIEKLVCRINGANVSASDIELRHTPELFSTFAIPYSYDPAALCPIFMDYLYGVQPEEEGRDALQMLAGLSLVPDCRYEVVFILYGESGTGKTVFLSILENLVGRENFCCLPLHKFTEKHSIHLLTEKLLNIVGDLPTSSENVSLHSIEGLLKDVASGGNLPVERKNRDPLTAPAIARCIFASNSLPAFADRSNGIWDRLRIIPFNQRFRNTEKQNPNLKHDIVRNELPGVFNWAIEGLAKLRKLKRFPDTAEGLKLVQKHRNDCDHERQFLADYEAYPGAYVIKPALYEDYRAFCLRNGFRSKNSTNFYNEVNRLFPNIYEEQCRVIEGRFRIFRNIRKMTET